MSPRRSFGRCYRKRRRDGTDYPGWYVRYVEAGARVERGGFATKDSALAFLAAREVERSEARALGLPELRRITIAEAVAEHLAHLGRTRRPATVSAAGTHLRALAERLGARDVLAVRREDIVQHLAALRRDRRYAPATLRLVAALLSGFGRWCVETRLARRNEWTNLTRGLPAVDVEEPPFLTADELRIVYAACPAAIRAPVVLMGEAGLRRNEAIGLIRAEVAGDLRSVTIGAGRSKGHRARTIPLTATARAALDELLGERATPIDRQARVFNLSASTLNREFLLAMDRIGRRDVTPRTLRHAFGSGLMRAGVDVATIQRLMGHRDVHVTMRYACHAPRNAGELAIRALEAHRAPSSESHARKAT